MYQLCDYQLPMPVPNTETSLVINALEIKKFKIKLRNQKIWNQSRVKIKLLKLNFSVSKFLYSKLSTNTF